MTKEAIQIACGREQAVAAIEEMFAKFERGELTCAAIRLLKSNGSHQDIVIGGDDDQDREEALAALHRAYERAH